MIRTQVLKHLPGARKEGAMERLGVDVSRSLREKRSEEMTQSTTSSPRDREYLLSPRVSDGN